MKIRNIYITLIILVLTILISYAFDQLGLRIDTILLTFVLAVLFISIETTRLMSVISTFLLAIAFNYLYITPRYSFEIDDGNYLLSLLIFILVAVIANQITYSLKTEVNQRKENQRIITNLNKISNLLLTINKFDELKISIESIIKEQIGYESNLILEENQIDKNMYEFSEAITFSLSRMIRVDNKIAPFQDLPVTIFPLLNTQKKIFLTVSCVNSKLSVQQQDFIESVCFQIRGLLEKEDIIIQKEKAQYNVEKEKFKNILLRSLSHDIKTPLTSIKSGIYLLKNSNQDKMNEDFIEIYNDINEEIERLDDLINNVLTMTQLQNDMIKLTIDEQNVNEFLEDIDYIFKKRYSNFILHIDYHESDTNFIYFDKSLMTQVFNNILDNAVKHSTKGNHVNIRYQIYEKITSFEIENDGGTLDQNKLNEIFGDFVSYSEYKGDHKRGFGLGLTISKAIIELHQGTIKAINNKVDGVTFILELPNEVKNNVK